MVIDHIRFLNYAPIFIYIKDHTEKDGRVINTYYKDAGYISTKEGIILYMLKTNH
jgi:hypothetical protein